MSDVRLVIRDSKRDIHATRHAGFAESVVAALSAEPTTIEELERAVERFISPGEHAFFTGFSRGIVDEPYDAGIVVVDLAARLVVCDTTYFAAGRKGCVDYHDGKSATDISVRYHLSDDWMLVGDALDWQALAEQRRKERAAQPPLDIRAVLFGKPLLEFIASECLAIFGKGPPLAASLDDEKTEELVRSIHARWLTTGRQDLRGEAPRDVLLAHRDYLSWDHQDRSEQWSMTLRCPPGLDPNLHAYRHAGFGTHELVMYYDLVRDLIWTCTDDVLTLAGSPAASAMMVGDFLTSEVPRLERMREARLDEPNPEFGGRTPRSIIHNERARIPEAMTGARSGRRLGLPPVPNAGRDAGPSFLEHRRLQYGRRVRVLLSSHPRRMGAGATRIRGIQPPVQRQARGKARTRRRISRRRLCRSRLRVAAKFLGSAGRRRVLAHAIVRHWLALDRTDRRFEDADGEPRPD